MAAPFGPGVIIAIHGVSVVLFNQEQRPFALVPAVMDLHHE